MRRLFLILPAALMALDQADEWAHENADTTGGSGPMARRWLARNGCECEDCHQRRIEKREKYAAEPECTCGDPGQYPCERHDCSGGDPDERGYAEREGRSESLAESEGTSTPPDP